MGRSRPNFSPKLEPIHRTRAEGTVDIMIMLKEFTTADTATPKYNNKL